MIDGLIIELLIEKQAEVKGNRGVTAIQPPSAK